MQKAMTPEEQKLVDHLEKMPPMDAKKSLEDLINFGISITETTEAGTRHIDPFSEEGMNLLEQRNNKP